MTDDIRREVDQLRRDIQREIDLRLKAEAEARAVALTALQAKSMNMGQVVTWIIAFGTAAVALYAVFHATR